MLVASTPCGSGYIHMYLLYYIATCAISTILDTHYVSPSITVSICMIFFCSSLSPPPLLGFSFDQHFGSSSVHVTAGVHTDSSMLYHNVIYCSLQWERVQRMSQFGHWAKISGPNQNLLVHLQSLSDPKEWHMHVSRVYHITRWTITRTHSYKLFCFDFFLQLHQAQKTRGR